MFIYQGIAADILNLQQTNCWKLVEEYRGFNILKEITTMCNDVYRAIEVQLVKYNSTSGIYRQVLENFRSMPEMCQFQSYRTNCHKKQQSRWHFFAPNLGGNSGIGKAAPSIPNEKHSIHRLLCDYHFWLPSLR